MPIQLSANTQVTGPVAKEVFDSNIGFQSGLDGLARGISQVASAADTFARSAKQANDESVRKDDIVSKQLASTNNSAFTTGLNSAYDNLSKVRSDSNATAEALAEAEAAVAPYRGELNAGMLDPNNEANPQYYANYVKTATARRDALELADKSAVRSASQFKALTQERAGINHYNAAATGVPSADPFVGQTAKVISTFDPNNASVISTLHNRAPADTLMLNELTQTFSTTMDRINELLPAKKGLELAKIEEQVMALAASGNPAAVKAADAFFGRISTVKEALGTAESKERAAQDKVYATKVATDKNAASLNITVDSVTGKADLNFEQYRVFKENIDPAVASDSAITQANDSDLDIILNLTDPDNNTSWLSGAVISELLGTPATQLPEEAFYRTDPTTGKVLYDKRHLIDDPATIERYRKAVTDRATSTKKALQTGDYSVLTKHLPAFAEDWKILDDPKSDEIARTNAWNRLDNTVRGLKNEPAAQELLAGARSFGILPETATPFSNMEATEKENYLKLIVAKNGYGSHAFAYALQNSPNESDAEIGTLLFLHNEGISEEAIADSTRGADIYAGNSITIITKKGEEAQKTSVPQLMYDSLRSRGLVTPLGAQILAANRVGNTALAKMLQNIEISHISDFLGKDIDTTPVKVAAHLNERQTTYTSALGRKLMAGSGVIATIPEVSNSYAKRKDVESFLRSTKPATVAMRYTKSINALFMDAMDTNKVPITPFLQITEESKTNSALAMTMQNRGSGSGESTLLSRLFSYDERGALERGVLEGETDSGIPYMDYSEIQQIDGIDYYVPRVLTRGEEGYKALMYRDDLGNKKTLRIPVNAVHDDVLAREDSKLDSFYYVL
jgi:hypothetical protein